jgi:hypothetical protein
MGRKKHFILGKTPLPNGLMGEERNWYTVSEPTSLGIIGGLIMGIGGFLIIVWIVYLMFFGGFEQQRQQTEIEYQQHIQEVSQQREFVRRYNTPEQNRRLDEWENRPPLNDYNPQ